MAVSGAEAEAEAEAEAGAVAGIVAAVGDAAEPGAAVAVAVAVATLAALAAKASAMLFANELEVVESPEDFVIEDEFGAVLDGVADADAFGESVAATADAVAVPTLPRDWNAPLATYVTPNENHWLPLLRKIAAE